MVIEKQIDALAKEQFTFWIHGSSIILDSYSLLWRENKTKRKYKNIKCYDRLYTRNSNIPLEQVPLTEEIKTEVLQEYIKTLKVMNWEEYKR